ncbi:CoA pyrophosphatase [Nakamurella antarctica]|uniref:CoA pyrophosphatase n=2 Tax=Nakamurella antarctica TaxID=1902245 RepID=A0A3G8ZPS3_9ACTN|nr:CoA pyrophosphatase [Nakamurella antarctica]
MQPLIHRYRSGPVPLLADRGFRPGTQTQRRSAVLMLLGEGPSGPDLLLTQRAAGMRTHSGQPAFPGGAVDVGEDAVMAALREGQEETGLDPAGVTPAMVLPELFLAASGFVVEPVLAYWHRPGPIRSVNAAETVSVARVPIAELADPANRVQVRIRHYTGPGFVVAGMTVWGFTGALVDSVLDMGGWAVPWSTDRVIDIEQNPALGITRSTR